MASEMVERLAKAVTLELARQDGYEGDVGWPLDSEGRVEYLDQLLPNMFDVARAAIEAMRESTKSVLSAGMTAADDALDSDWDSGANGENYNSYTTLRSDAPIEIWQAMIDAALA